MFIIAFNNFDDTKENELLDKNINEDKLDKFSIPVQHYSKNSTKNVSHKLDSLLNRINKRHDFHGAVLVAKNKKIVYQNQVGYADFRKKTPLNSESVFQLASVSKQFTAAAIMQLKEKSKLKLTDSVNAYFPDFPYKNITIRNLLNHTSGLPKYFWVAEHEWKENKPPTNKDLMEVLPISKAQRFFKPGRNFDYSNTGYFVLASIIEKVTGISFNQYLQKNIFEPLNMRNSYVYSYQNDTIRKNQLKGYRLYRGWKHIKIGNTVNDAIVGDKNVYSTLEDLFKWTYGLNSGGLITQESLDLMYTKGETIYGRKVPYGFGFRLDGSDKKNIYHYGKWNGFSTALTNYLEEDMVVIVLEHTSYNSLKYLNKKIKKIVTENFKT
ncbi:serine hydrolase domain-containing protein [uncultured Polaribacter sp.]|uniref:serine hydrolase domain-containing protein n=1 Tax=uncultured Polaribacter sp. TaxID=174711 RepID=UPI0026381E52|nr:serine hydrolase domain-containing protein [uncultured Polaribacter sp.]